MIQVKKKPKLYGQKMFLVLGVWQGLSELKFIIYGATS